MIQETHGTNIRHGTNDGMRSESIGIAVGVQSILRIKCDDVGDPVRNADLWI